MKFIQKVGAFLLIWVLLSTSLMVDAADKVSFTVSSAKGATGDTVMISVSVGANSKIAACTMKLIYDANKLQCVLASKGTIPVDIALNPVVESGVITYSFARLTDLTAAGTVITAQFRILSTINETIPLKLDISVCTDQNTKTIETTVVNGSVEVTSSGGSSSSASNSSVATRSTAGSSTTSSSFVITSQTSSTPSNLPSIANVQPSVPTASEGASSSTTTKSQAVPSAHAGTSQPSAAVSTTASSGDKTASERTQPDNNSSMLTDSNSGISIMGSLPDGVLINAVKIDNSSDLYAIYNNKLANEKITELYNIILLENNNVYTSPVPLKVFVPQPKESVEKNKYRVAVFQEDGTILYAEPAISENGLTFNYEKGSFFALVTDNSTYPILPVLIAVVIVLVAAVVIVLIKLGRK